ncbi:MAG: GNAT family N-acetyltransferase [Spirochaetales bacterium]
MAIEIRELRDDNEARELQRIGRRSFHPGFFLLIPKPKWAFGAFDDGTCLGGVYLKKIAGVGLVEFIFIAKEGRGHGLGKRLTERALEAFREQGIETAVASVRDDNTASWNLFAGRGFHALSLAAFVRQFGLGRAFLISLASAQAFAFGFDLWAGSVDAALSSNPPTPDAREAVPGGSLSSLIGHLFLNLLPVTAAVWRFGESYAQLATALGLVIVARLLFGYLGSLPFYRPARLRMARGGWLIEVPVQIFGSTFFYPAHWQPKLAHWREPDFRRGLGVSALLSILGVMAVLGAASLLLASGALTSVFAVGTALITVDVAKLVLILEAQPLFEAWSGPRVRRWNLPVYLVVLAGAIALVAFA